MRKWIILTLAFNTCFFAQGSCLSPDMYTVDYTDFYDKAKQYDLYQQVNKALRELGFIVIKNAPLNKQEIKQAYQESRLFFMAAEEEKNKTSGREYSYDRGYCPFRKERAKDHFLADRKESFMVGLYPSKKMPNLWPKRKEFSKIMHILPFTLMSLAKECLEFVAKSASLRSDIFSSYVVKENPSVLRLIRNPAFKESTRTKIWTAAHTDISLISLVVCPWVKGAGKGFIRGIEIEAEDGEWVQIHTPKQSVVLRVGDLLQNLTNGYFKSARFRVSSVEEMHHKDRYAIDLFCHPPGDTDLTPFACFIEKTGGVALYPKATRDELFAERLVDVDLANSEAMLPCLITSGLVDRMKTLKMASPRVIKKIDDYKNKSQKSDIPNTKKIAI